MAKEIPIGIKIISIVYQVVAGFLALAAVMLFVGSGSIVSYFDKIPILSVIGTVGAGLFIFAGIMCLIFGTLNFFIGRGLWKKKNWARVFVIIFSIIGVIIGLTSVARPSFGGIFQLLISGFIGGYLIFSKEVKKAFK